MLNGKTNHSSDTCEVLKEPSVSPDFNKRLAAILLFTSIILVSLPCSILHLWSEDNRSENDFVVFVLIPCLYLYIMLFCPIALICLKPKVAVFDFIWYRWIRSEFIRIPFLALAVILVCIVSYILSKMIPAFRDNSFLFFRDSRNFYSYFVWTFVYTVLLSPVLEEIFWRGYVQGTLTKISRPWIAIFLQSFFFGLYHFKKPLLGIFSRGLIYGIWRYKRNTLIPIIVMHILYNLAAMLILWSQIK